MSQDDIIGWLGFFIICLLIGGCTVGVGYLESKRVDDEIAASQKVIDDFGCGVKVIELYVEQHGSKPANYSHHYMVVVENENGERLRVYMGSQNPIRGDSYSLRAGPNKCGSRRIYLDKRL